MTKKQIEALRAKLENPDYIKEACADIGSRLAHEWEKIGYLADFPDKKPKCKVKNLPLFRAMLRDAPTMTVDELAQKYNKPPCLVRQNLRHNGITPKSWSYKNEKMAKSKTGMKYKK
jgi:hypothetical protein